MTPKQQRFVNEYLIDLNATQAAKRAGYSAKTSYSTGQRLLKVAEISEAISEKVQKAEEKAGLSVQYVLDGLLEVADRCLQRKPVMVFDRSEKQYVQKTDANGEGIWTFDSAGANRALELLGKYHSMFKEQVNVTGFEGMAEQMREAEERLKAAMGAGDASRQAEAGQETTIIPYKAQADG